MNKNRKSLFSQKLLFSYYKKVDIPQLKIQLLNEKVFNLPEEAITQGKASASKALTLLAKKESLFTSGTIASVDFQICSACGVCISICPYNAPDFAKEGWGKDKAEINPVLCKGCGLCVASCRSGAIHLKGFDTNQIFSQIFALG